MTVEEVVRAITKQNWKLGGALEMDLEEAERLVRSLVDPKIILLMRAKELLKKMDREAAGEWPLYDGRPVDEWMEDARKELETWRGA